MPNDLLQAYANERIDLFDFDFLADEGLQANIRQPLEQFFTDPTGTPSERSWILDGFDIDNPAGDQVRVTKGRAILGQREGALVFYGALTVEGDTEKIVDMSALTPSASYGLYVRFEYVDGDNSSRIFWNPSGTGSETAQTVATRRNANWSIRIELSNPGAEWLKIATLDNTGVGVAITDERPLYFEGEIHNSYQSGWSTDGGGDANDRNADRQQYGVKDFQTFTAAMRQSLEDIKGRGLRRWWDRDIGGMNIGFDAAPVEDTLAVGDAAFRLYFDGTDPWLYGSATEYLTNDRSAQSWSFYAGGNQVWLTDSTGTRAEGFSSSTDLTVTPRANSVRVGDGFFELYWDGTDTFLYWDDDDYFWYDRSNRLHMRIGGTSRFSVGTSGSRSTGFAISDDLNLSPNPGELRIYDTNFSMSVTGSGNTPVVYWDVNDSLSFDRSSDQLSIYLNSVHIWRASDTGISARGIAVSSDLSLSPLSNTIKVGDDNFRLRWDGTDPYLYWTSADYLWYDVSTNTLTQHIDGTDVVEFGATGGRIRGLSVNSGLGLAAATNQVRVGDDVNFRMEWDGTDPFIYFDSGDYLQFDRSYDVNGAFLFYVNNDNEVIIDKDSLHAKGFAVSSPLTLGALANGVRVGHADFNLFWDGTDPFINVDSGDYIQFDRSLGTFGSFLFYINSTNVLSVYSDGANAIGLSVSDPIGLGVESNSIRVGSINFKMNWDGTDPYIYFDSQDYLQFDRSSNTLNLATVNVVRHTWFADSGLMLGANGLTGITKEGEYTYDNSRGVWVIREETNTGSVNTHEKKGASSLIYRDIAYSQTVTTAGNTFCRCYLKAGRQNYKIFKLTTWGTAKNNDTSDLSISIGIDDGSLHPVIAYSFTPDAADTNDDVRDQWWGECTFFMPTGGTSVRINTYGKIGFSEAAGFPLVESVVSTSYDKVTGINMEAIDIALYVRGICSSGTKVVHVRGFMVEELFGE